MRNFILVFLILGINIKLSTALVKYLGEQFRDPFESYLPEVDLEKSLIAQEFEKLKLTGIIWGSDMPLAIINDKVYKIGDSILGAKIVEIDKKGVLLDYKGKTYLLKTK